MGNDLKTSGVSAGGAPTPVVDAAAIAEPLQAPLAAGEGSVAVDQFVVASGLGAHAVRQRDHVAFHNADLTALRVILGLEPLDVDEVLRILKVQPALADLWDKIVAPREGLALADHIRLVLQLYVKYLANRPLPSQVSRDFFTLILALHDIGKPISLAAGDTSKTTEHAHTLQIIHDVFMAMGYSEWHYHVAVALVDSELAPYVKAAWETPHSEKKLLSHLRRYLVEQLRVQAGYTGLSVADIFNLKLTYYMADAGAYTTEANGGMPQQAEKSAFDDLFSFNPTKMTMGFAASVTEAMHDLFVDVQWFDQLDKAKFKEGAENIVLLDYDGLFSNGEQAGEFLRILEASPQVDRIYLFGHFKPKFFLWAKSQFAKLKGSLAPIKYDPSGIGAERMRWRGTQILKLANIDLHRQNVIVLDGEPEAQKAQLVGMGGIFHVFGPRLLADRDRYLPSTIRRDWAHIEKRLAEKRGPAPLPPEPRPRTAVKGAVRGERALHSQVIRGGAAFVRGSSVGSSGKTISKGAELLTDGSNALQPGHELVPEPTGAEEPRLHIVADSMVDASTDDAPFAVTQVPPHALAPAAFSLTPTKPFIRVVATR